MLSQKVLFFSKNAVFCKTKADISKSKEALVLNGIFSETKYVYYIFYPSPHRTAKPPSKQSTQIRVKYVWPFVTTTH